MGELAAEIKKTWSANYKGTSKEKLAEECSDVFCVLIAISQAFEIDIEQAVLDKFFSKDEKRKWVTQKRAASKDGSPLRPKT